MAKAKNEEPVEMKVKTFPLTVLRRECRKLFDISSSTFDGATCSLDPNKEYSIEEIKNTINKWKERRV
jgi:hypothetical protein